MSLTRKLKYTNLLALRATKRSLTLARMEAAGTILVALVVLMGMKVALLG
jgi:hypothetical protein